MYQYADYLHILSIILEDYAKESLPNIQNINTQPAEHKCLTCQLTLSNVLVIYIQRISQPYPTHQAFIFDKMDITF